MFKKGLEMEVNDKVISENNNKNTPTIKRKLANIAFLMCSGAVGYEYFFDNRYTIEQEYSLISTCVAKNGASTKVKKACICALKETQKENSFKNNASFGYIMSANYSKCF